MIARNPHFEMSVYKAAHSFNDRLALGEGFRKTHPHMVPVVVERSPKAKIGDVRIRRFLVPYECAFGHLYCIVRKQLRIRPQVSLILYVKDVIPTPSVTIGALYHSHRDEDLLLYISYQDENIYGGGKLSKKSPDNRQNSTYLDDRTSGHPTEDDIPLPEIFTETSFSNIDSSREVTAEEVAHDGFGIRKQRYTVNIPLELIEDRRSINARLAIVGLPPIAPGAAEQQGTSEQRGPSEGAGEQRGPSEGAGEQRGPSEGAGEQQGHSEGAVEQRGPSEGAVEQRGPSERAAEQPGPSHGAAEQPGPSEETVDEPDTCDKAAEHQGTTEVAVEQPGPSKGAAKQPGPSEETTEQPGPSKGAAKQPGPSEETTEQPGTSDEAAEHQDTSEEAVEHQGKTEAASEQTDTSEEAAGHLAPSEWLASHQGLFERDIEKPGSIERATEKLDSYVRGTEEHDTSDMCAKEQRAQGEGSPGTLGMAKRSVEYRSTFEGSPMHKGTPEKQGTSEGFENQGTSETCAEEHGTSAQHYSEQVLSRRSTEMPFEEDQAEELFEVLRNGSSELENIEETHYAESSV